MKIRELEEFLKNLPQEFKEFDIAIRSFDAEEDGNTYMYDLPIISGFVDEENRELCLLDEENTELYKKLNQEDGNQEESQ